MTTEQKSRILQLRHIGRSYSDIGTELGISKDTVKSFCRRNKLSSAGAAAPDNGDICRECGTSINQIPKQKKRIFCCKACREQWWKKHPEQLHQKAVYSFVCAECGKPFEAYGNANRKYCSHACYINHRFKGGVPHD